MSSLTVPLSKEHNKKDFFCGKSLLDKYLHKQASQDIKRKISTCFLLSDSENNIKGYYTLSNAGVDREKLPQNISKRFPPFYSELPVTLLGRLAVDQKFRGQGLGKFLLIDALLKSYTATKSIASFAVVVDLLDNDAEQFYSKYSFIKLPSSGKMFLPMKTIEQLFIKRLP